LGIQPVSLETGHPISPQVRSAIRQIVQTFNNLL
jgi:hypothetical protein